MLYSCKGICTFDLNAADGHVGKIKDVYFDDLEWIMRYLVIETGTSFNGRQILIAPEALVGRRDNKNAFMTNLSRSQVRDSPTIDSDRPVSRQFEEQLRRHYAWTSYWSSPAYALGSLFSFPSGSLPYQDERRESVEDGATQHSSESCCDSHLRSLQEVCGYHVQAEDGEIGEVGDLFIEPETWRVTQLMAKTRIWWPGKHVLIEIGMINGISWPDRRVSVAMTRDQVRSALEYLPGMIIQARHQHGQSSDCDSISEPPKLEERVDRDGSAFEGDLAEIDRSWRQTTGSSPQIE